MSRIPRAALAATLLLAACAEAPTSTIRKGGPVFPGVSSFAITTRDVTILQDSSFHMAAVALDAHGAPATAGIRWGSGNRQALYVDSLGLVVGRRAGTVVVRAKVDGMMDSTFVTVIGTNSLP